METRNSRAYVLLVAGHIVSTFGSSIYLITLVLYLAAITNSPAVLGLIQFAAYLPAALFGPVAGALVDRWSRRNVLIRTDLIRGVVLLAAAGVGFVLGHIPVPVVFLVTVVVSGAGVLFVPAVHALIPDLVDEPGLKRANGIRASANQIANLAGSGVGATLYVLLGGPLIFALNGLTFLLSGISETPIQEKPRHDQPQTHIWASVRDGFRLLKNASGIRALVAVQATAGLLLPPLVVSLPFVIRDTWMLPETFFGLYFATVLAGGVLAFATLSGRHITRKHESAAYRWSFPAITGFLILLACLSASWFADMPVVRWLLFPAFVVAGAAVGTLHIVGVTRIQQLVEPANRGRVFAAAETASAALLPVIYVVSGVAAEALRDRPWVLFTMIAALAGGISVVLLRSQSIRATLRGVTAATR